MDDAIGIEAVLVCLVPNCAARFKKRSEAWKHIEEHGLETYFSAAVALAPKKPAPAERDIEQ